MFEITSESLVDGFSQLVETHEPLHIPGVEGLLIPSKTRGHVLKVFGGNTALVRWEVNGEQVLNILYLFANCLTSKSIYISGNKTINCVSEIDGNINVIFSCQSFIQYIFNYKSSFYGSFSFYYF